MKKGQRKNSQKLKEPKPYYSKSRKRWVAQVRMLDGKYRARFVHSKDDAYDAIQEMLADRAAGVVGENSVKSSIDQWLAAGDWRAKTRQDYADTSKKMIDLYEIPLRSLNQESVQQVLDNIKSTAMRDRVRSTLRTMLNWCVFRKMIRSNPVVDTQPVKHKRQPIEVFEPDETVAILNELPDRWRGPTELMLLIGLRPGECWALQWSDWTGKTLKILRAVKEVDSVQVVEPTKTSAGLRTLPLPDAAIKIMEQRRVVAMKAGHAGKSFPIFANTRGGMVRQGNFRHKVWRIAMQKAQVPYKVPYTLRHSFATWSLNSGQVSLAAVSKYLGHAKQSTTLDHYSHLMVGELEQVSKFWNERTG